MATGEYGRKEAEQAYRLFESMYEQIAGRRPFTRDTEITERAESAGSYGRRTPNDVVKLLERLINQGVAIDDAASYLLEAAQAYPPVTSGYGMAYYTPTQLVTAYERYAQGGMEGTPYEGAVAAETGNVPRATGRTLTKHVNSGKTFSQLFLPSSLEATTYRMDFWSRRE